MVLIRCDPRAARRRNHYRPSTAVCLLLGACASSAELQTLQATVKELRQTVTELSQQVGQPIGDPESQVTTVYAYAQRQRTHVEQALRAQCAALQAQVLALRLHQRHVFEFVPGQDAAKAAALLDRLPVWKTVITQMTPTDVRAYSGCGADWVLGLHFPAVAHADEIVVEDRTEVLRLRTTDQSEWVATVAWKASSLRVEESATNVALGLRLRASLPNRRDETEEVLQVEWTPTLVVGEASLRGPLSLQVDGQTPVVAGELTATPW